MNDLPKQKNSIFFKIITLALACLFLFNQISYASGNFELISLRKSTLAPEGLMTVAETQAFLQAKLLCSAIEKKAREAEREKTFSLSGIKEWANLNPSSEEYKDVILIDYGSEIHLLVKGTLLIRYFDPEKTSFKFLFPEDKANLLIPQTGPVAPFLKREVYKLTLDELKANTCEDVFAHIIKKAGLEDRVKITVGALSEELTDDQYAICEIQKIGREKGRLIIHPEFVQDYEDIKSANIGFPCIFADGKMRWIDLADSVTYRAAMHEFKLPRREGHGHAYLDEEGIFKILKDAELNNTLGRRYSVINDAMWLWYLHSYKAHTDDIRYDNDAFLWRIHNWLFYSDSKEAEAARLEFPVLVKDAEKREQAIRLALSINKAFFIDRRARGAETTPAFKKDKIRPGKATDTENIIDSAFATEKGKRYSKWTPEQIAKIPDAIRTLNEVDVDVNSFAMQNDTSEETSQLIAGILNRPAITGKALHKKASSIYGSWNKALMVAGLNPDEVRRINYWTKEDKDKMPQAIKALHDAEIDLNSSAITNDRSQKTALILAKIFERDVVGKTLQRKAIEFYGSWDNALLGAGLDPKQIRKRFYWTKADEEKIPHAIRELHDAEMDVNSKTIEEDTSGEISRILEKIFGRSITGQAFLQKAIQIYGSWDNALLKAGFNPSEIRISTPWEETHIEKIPQAIRELHDAGADVNSSAIQNDTSEETSQILEEILGRKNTTGKALYQKAIQVYGSWNNALLKAGLDPKKIQHYQHWTPAHNSALFLKGRIFEGLVRMVYQSAYGERLEFERQFLVSAFTQECRYPDYFVEGVVIADAKWGLGGQDIVDTVLKYTRLKKACKRSEPLKIVVCDISEMPNIKTALDKAAIEGLDYTIIDIEALMDMLQTDPSLREKVRELLRKTKAHQYDSEFLEHNVYNEVKTERQEERYLGLPIWEEELWQGHLIRNYMQGEPDKLISSLEEAARRHSAFWEWAYHMRMITFLSYVYDKIDKTEFSAQDKMRIKKLILGMYPEIEHSPGVWKKIVRYYKLLKSRKERLVEGITDEKERKDALYYAIESEAALMRRLSEPKVENFNFNQSSAQIENRLERAGRHIKTPVAEDLWMKLTKIRPGKERKRTLSNKSKQSVFYRLFIAPWLEELFRVGTAFGVLAILNRLTPYTPILNIAIFTVFLVTTGTIFTGRHILNERAPPEDIKGLKARLKFYLSEIRSLYTQEKLLIFGAPIAATIAGIVFSFVFISNPAEALKLSIATHFLINSIIFTANYILKILGLRISIGYATLPEELLEIPHETETLRPERELNERLAEINACDELEMDTEKLIATLEQVNQDWKTATTDDEMYALEGREEAFIKELASLYRNIPVTIHENRTYGFYSRMLADMRERQEKIYKKFEEASKKDDRNALKRLNLEAIRLNKLLVKLGLMIAGKLLMGRSKLPNAPTMRQAALWTLKGVVNNTIALREELLYRMGRLRGKEVIRKLETINWVGEIVQASSLADLDIEILEPQEEAPTVMIRQSRWINVHTTLDNIRKSVNKGIKKEALKKLSMLIRLYSVRYIVIMEKYKDITSDLRALMGIIQGLPDAHAPPEETQEEIKQRINTLTSQITHPKQRVWVGVNYKNLKKAFRGKLKSIKEYYKPECKLILSARKDLEHYLEMLKQAVKRNRLSKANKRTIINGLTRITGWVDRGFVKPKQIATGQLRPAIDLIESGNFTETQQHLAKTIEQFNIRLGEITGTVGNIKEHAASIYAELRDEDIKNRIDIIAEAIELGDYTAALSEAQEIRDSYFTKALVEPGYIRAEHTLRLAESTIRALSRLKQGSVIEKTKEKAKEYLDLIKLHVKRKNLPQFGKRARVKSIKLQKKKGTAQVLDSKGREHTIDLKPEGRLDIAALKVQFEEMKGLEESHRGLILAILKRLEHSPPKFYTFNTAIEDLLGFADDDKDLIALHEDLAQNPIALFHEIGEYLIKKGMLAIEVKDEKIALLLSGVKGKGKPKTKILLTDILKTAFPKTLQGTQAILRAWDAARTKLEQEMGETGIAGYASGELYSEAREDDIPELVAEIPIDATLLGDEDWWGQGEDLSPHYSLRVLQRTIFKDGDLALTKAVRDIQAAQGEPVAPVIVQRGAKAEPAEPPVPNLEPKARQTHPIIKAPKTQDAVHSEIVKLKGRIFEQLVLKLYRAAGIDVEYQAPMPGNEFIEENRYPDFVVERERIVDTKWGFACEDIINTILKYTRLSRMYEFRTPVTIIVYEPDYVGDVKAHFDALNKIMREDESMPESQRRPVEYEIIVFDNQSDSFVKRLVLAAKNPEAEEAVRGARDKLTEVNNLLSRETSDNANATKKALIKILRHLQGENNERVEKPETATPLKDAEAWQRYLRGRYIENPEALVTALEFTRKYHFPVWEKKYCDRLQAYLSFILDEIGRIDPQYKSRVEELIFSIYPGLRGTSGYWRTLINYKELNKERYMLRAEEAIEPGENPEENDELNEKQPASHAQKWRQRRQGAAAAAVKVFTSAGRIEAVKAHEGVLSGEVAELRKIAGEKQAARVEREAEQAPVKAPEEDESRESAEEKPEPSQIRFKPSLQIYGANKFESTAEPDVAREFGVAAPVNSPAPGYVRLIGNEELAYIIKVMEHAGLGSVFDGAITYARTQIEDTRFLACSGSYFGERDGMYQGVIEVVIPDITPECVDKFLREFHDVDVKGARNPADMPASKEEKEKVIRDLMVAAIIRSIGYQIAGILQIENNIENSGGIKTFIDRALELKAEGPYEDGVSFEEWFGDLLCRYCADKLGLHFKVQNIVQHQVRIPGEKEYLDGIAQFIAQERTPLWNEILATGKAKRVYEKAQGMDNGLKQEIAKPYKALFPPANFILSGGYRRLEDLYLYIFNNGNEDILRQALQQAVAELTGMAPGLSEEANPAEQEVSRPVIDNAIRMVFKARREKPFRSGQEITQLSGRKSYYGYNYPFASSARRLMFFERLAADIQENPEEGDSASPILTDEILRKHGVMRTSFEAPEEGYERVVGGNMIDEVKALLQNSGFGFIFNRTDISYGRSDNPKSIIISASGKKRAETVFVDVKEENVKPLLRSFVDISRILQFWRDIESMQGEDVKAVIAEMKHNGKYAETFEKARQITASRIKELVPFDVEGMPDDLKRALILREITSNIGHAVLNNLTLKAVNEENIPAQILLNKWFFMIAARKWHKEETVGLASLEKLQKNIMNKRPPKPFFADLFGITFSMFVNKKSILYDLGEKLTGEEEQFCRDLADFMRDEEAKGGWVTKSSSMSPQKAREFQAIEEVLSKASPETLEVILHKTTYFSRFSRKNLRAVIQKLIDRRPLSAGMAPGELMHITNDASATLQIMKEMSEIMQLKEISLLENVQRAGASNIAMEDFWQNGLVQNPVAGTGSFATDNAKYRASGPGTPNYEEKGDVLRVALNGYLDENLPFLTESFAKDADSALLRVPIEILKALGKKDAKLFLSALSQAVVIELYSATKKFKITEKNYTEYRIEKKGFKGEKNRKNTITLFLTGKDDEIKSESDLIERISADHTFRPRDTILMPVGLYNSGEDLSGLVRSSILGLKLLEIARNPSNKDFIRETAEQFQKLCRISTTEAFGLDSKNLEGYLKDLATGNINAVIRSLRELIKLLPIKPINPEELQKIYKHAQEIVHAA